MSLLVRAHEKASPASKSVSFGPECFCIAALAVNFAVGTVAAQNGVEGPFTAVAGETFLKHDPTKMLSYLEK